MIKKGKEEKFYFFSTVDFQKNPYFRLQNTALEIPFNWETDCFCVRNADNSSDWKLKLRLYSWSPIPYSHSESKICGMCCLLKHMTPRWHALHLLTWFLLCKIPIYKAWMSWKILYLRADFQPIEQKLLSDKGAWSGSSEIQRREKWQLIQFLLIFDYLATFRKLCISSYLPDLWE